MYELVPTIFYKPPLIPPALPSLDFPLILVEGYISLPQKISGRVTGRCFCLIQWHFCMAYLSPDLFFDHIVVNFAVGNTTLPTLLQASYLLHSLNVAGHCGREQMKCSQTTPLNIPARLQKRRCLPVWNISYNAQFQIAIV